MKKDYYIQGDPARAKEIKAAFQELGINVLDFGFADKAVVYCSIGECVQYLPYSINLMNILYSHPAYMELPLPVKPNPKFKIGDWLFHKTKGIFPLMVEDYDEKEGYLMQSTDETKCYFGRDIIENDYRLWTIQDAKDGDVLAAHECYVIFKEIDGLNIKCYCAYHYMGFNPTLYKNTLQNKTVFKPANKEQCDFLFKCIKENGYVWDADKKELKKILKHYDISSFHEGMPVLVRDGNTDEWNYLLFSHYRKKMPDHFFAGGNPWYECIPFNEETKHLLGTTDMCDEQYINW